MDDKFNKNQNPDQPQHGSPQKAPFDEQKQQSEQKQHSSGSTKKSNPDFADDRDPQAGSRDVTEGAPGGSGTETGGSRNYRSGSGAAGSDTGNKPE